MLICKTSGWPKINSLKHLTVHVRALTLSWGIAFWAMVFIFSLRDRKLFWDTTFCRHYGCTKTAEAYFINDIFLNVPSLYGNNDDPKCCEIAVFLFLNVRFISFSAFI